MLEFNNFEAIQIGLASPEKIREWSRGEVKKPETINYRTLKPERDGLFCERIFGPTKDWECHCGKYKKIRYKGIVCDKCGVEVTKAKVRRERMGHIELAAPVSHIWYFKGIPSRMGLILDISPRILEKVLYFASYIVIDPGKTLLEKKQVLSEKEYKEAYERYGDRFRAGMGAEAIRELLAEIDMDSLAEELREELADSVGQKKVKIIKRLEVVESFKNSNNKPEWMIMEVVPVIPPEIRPMVQLDGGRFATSDLNDLYRRVINRNNRLKRLLELGAPDIIVRNEKRMLQEAVDALIDNGRRGRPVTGPGNRPLKSLSDMLKGKQGRFRQNLLGKRVDYSGRSVIVVGPELKIYQCGLPKEMAIELFKPFVMKKLVNDGTAHNIKSAKRMVERLRPEIWDVLEEVIREHPVFLNRAPTLHRLGIQAFEPVLVEGRALKLHPLVCTAFNADFDGDQMAVHVPLSVEAQAEARFLMLSANNLLKPQDGRPVTVPTQDMVLGSYYLNLYKHGEPGEGKVFASEDEVLLAYNAKAISLHSIIKVRKTAMFEGKEVSGIIQTTCGRIIFNNVVPQNLGFVDRTKLENVLDYEIDVKTRPATDEEAEKLAEYELKVANGENPEVYMNAEEYCKKTIVDGDGNRIIKYYIITDRNLVGKKMLGKIIDKCIAVYDMTKTAEVLDSLKALGFKYSTKGAITISVSDIEIPEEKAQYLAEAEETIEKITKQYRRGLMTDDERYVQVINTWNDTSTKVTNALMSKLDQYNPIFMMADSGARGSVNQIRQLAAMRGLMANTSGRAVEIPIRANFREGLNVLEYFISTHGARKGLADTALRTADSGYMTRRLVDVAQDLIIRAEDCGTEEYITVTAIKDGNEMIEKLEDRLEGRYTAEDVVNPATGEIIVAKGELMTLADAGKIVAAGIETVKIRSVLKCELPVGVCAKCYGSNLAVSGKINIGESVGIIAAQSIGEPGTQLTMRTFHTGGVAQAEDITQGLPRVEELFEARKPKGLAVIAEIGGRVAIEEIKNKRKEIKIFNDDTGETVSYPISYGSRIKVEEGQIIEPGDELTEGSVNPHDILKIKGVTAVQNYLIQEVQRVYRLQGVDINDRHVEVIVRQMMRKVRVEDPGDTMLLSGSLVDISALKDANNKLEEGQTPATYTDVLLGITKASLATDSFLSAASFQETTRVLTDAAIKGKVDPLLGLKENVIIGKLIPAGTGMAKYRNVSVETPVSEPEIVE